MAQTVGIINGTLIGVYVGSTKIANATSGDLDISMATRETTNKDSAGWKSSLGSTLSWSCSAEGMFAEDAAYGYDDLFTAMIARTAVAIKVSSEVVGDKLYSGNALITNLKRTAPLEGNVTFTCSFEGTGVLAESTKA